MRYARVTRSMAAAAVLGLGLLPAGAQMEQTAEQPAPHAFPQARFAAQDTGIDRLTEAFHMTNEQPSPARGFGPPTSMLAAPGDPWVIVAATHDLRSRTCYLLRSLDAGSTWQFSQTPPGPADYPYCLNNNAGVAAASIAWGRDGTLYYAREGYGDGEGMRNGQSSIVLARSTDLGDTWQTTVVEDNRGKTGETAPAAHGVSGLAVDTSGARDVVYVGYTRRYRDAPEDSPLRNPHVLVAVSTDGGASFDEPVELNEQIDLTRTIAGEDYPLLMQSSFGAPFMTVHDGTLLVVAGSTTPADHQPPPPPEAGADLRPGTWYAHPMPQLIARSTDNGRTWSFATLGPPIYAGAGAQTGMGWTPIGGPDGTFVVAYAATPESSSTTGMADLVVQRSTDGGRTWTDPVAIDDDNPADGYTSFYPQLAVAPNGRIDVVWQDNRNETDFRMHVRYTYSTDGGQTWAPNVQINDQPLDFNLGISFNSDLRYPPGVASTDHYATFGWADSRFADDVTHTQDSFGAIAQFTPLPPRSSAMVPVAIAIAGGLAAAALILLLAVLMQRRREPPPPEPVKVPETVGAK
jgi:hypothetical protein